MANVFCKAACQVPGMETASPFTRFWREPEPIVAAAEHANSRAHCGRRIWLKLNRASRSRPYRPEGAGVLLRAPPRSGLRITSRAKPLSRAVVGLTRRHLLQSQKLFIQGEPCGATSAMHRWDDLLPVHGPGCGRRLQGSRCGRDLSPGSLAALQARALGRTQYMCTRLPKPIREVLSLSSIMSISGCLDKA
jgi:hypothetical protein